MATSNNSNLGLMINNYDKTDFRMQQNYLLGSKGIQINALMAATAGSLKNMIEKLIENILQFIF
ncbi:MAG: hypothetical protein FWD66_08580 [Paludibacter sp.]|nr:hypothetical protein [Paludibacter sp.]